MLKKIHKNYQGFLARWTIDRFEREFIKYFSRTREALNKECAEKSPRNILVQMPTDYYYLCIFHFAIQCSKDIYINITGLWHQNIMSTPRDEIFPNLLYRVRKVFNLFDLYKWERLYKAIGITGVSTLEVGGSDAYFCQNEAEVIWKGLKSKRELLDLVLNGTPCGDLIYDTYLRYRIQPTVDLSDRFLGDLIEKALTTQVAINRILEQRNIGVFLTSYSSYIQHGIPVREALKKGVEVFTAGNLSQTFKRLDVGDFLHAASHWKYGELFSNLSHEAKEEALQVSQVALEGRFSGEIDLATAYMKESAYSDNSIRLPAGIDGVLFLHDFFDSPHCYRDMLFEDFWEWANFTLQVISEEKLSIAVKPHPNQLPESAEVVGKLKTLYPSVQWIDAKTSNTQIFKSRIQIGISVYGTILHELAYHGIAALAAGDHPHVDFQIAHTPKSIQEYRNLLVNYKKLTLYEDAKSEVLKFYFMHNIYDKEELLVDVEHYNFRNLEQNHSIALKKYMDFKGR